MLYKVLRPDGEYGLFTDQFIPKEEVIFSAKEWNGEGEPGWKALTLEQVKKLSPEKRENFLKYGIDLDFNLIYGTPEPGENEDLSIYMNHSCRPNTGFNLSGSIVAYRDLFWSEELTIDYGTFIVNTDQDFVCNCGFENCRRRITKNDWQNLIAVYGLRFPLFLHPYVKDELS